MTSTLNPLPIFTGPVTLPAGSPGCSPSPYARHEHHDFHEATQDALRAESLQRALARMGDSIMAGHKSAFASLPGSDLLRDKARAIKDETMAHLDQYLGHLADAVERLGGRVHFANDAAEANAIIAQIARERGLKKIVKSKSMVTEEIHLNSYLEGEGFEVVETDFGEFVVQLAGERPSHIVGPAIHISAKDMAKLFNHRFKTQLTDNPIELTAFARAMLRRKFAEADMGISGANLVVAETGTVVLVSNEGNIRLTTSLPRVLVTVAGIEKLIPKLEDLPVFLKILARAATGQKLSIYTSMVTGPRRAGEADGPEEFHLVLLDNGRSKILGSPMRESLFCIRCGACLNACPVYRTIGGHAYGGTYSGPIGAVLTPLLAGVKENIHQPHASSLCGACQAACPVRIQIPELLVLNRAAQHEQHITPRGEELIYKIWARTLRSPTLYKWGAWWAGKLMPLVADKGWISKLPGPLAGWTKSRDFPAPATKSFRQRWKEELQEEDDQVTNRQTTAQPR